MVADAEHPAPIPLAPLSGVPLVSVLVANHDYERYLGRAIHSALSQTWPEIEVVVCDDGSRDGSVALVRRFAARFPRVRLVCQANRGQPAALSRAFAASRGEILAILDADDVFHPEKIRRTVESFCRCPRAGLSAHRVRPVDATGRPIGPDLPPRLEAGWLRERAISRGGWAPLPPASGLSFRRAVGERLFPLPARLHRMADGFVARAALFLTEVAAVPGTLGDYRIHGQNLTGASAVTRESLLRTTGDGRLLLAAIRDFVAAVEGRDLAERLRDEDVPGYREQRLACDLLGGEGGAFPDDLAALSVGRRLLWRGIRLLPTRAARARLLSLWWGGSPLKRSLARIVPVRLGGAVPVSRGGTPPDGRREARPAV